ncbi:MAG: hypothetical protein ACI9TY_000500 [Alphaproteobacteria bacterium]|jgi:hypothetical protein
MRMFLTGLIILSVLTLSMVSSVHANAMADSHHSNLQDNINHDTHHELMSLKECEVECEGIVCLHHVSAFHGLSSDMGNFKKESEKFFEISTILSSPTYGFKKPPKS